MIVFRCLKCKTTMSAPAELAGEALECPECGNVTAVPREVATPVVVPQRAAPVTSPVHGAGPIPVHQTLVTVQQTSKPLKAAGCLTGLATMAGVAWWVLEPANPIGPLLTFGGLAMFVVVRIAAWWQHG